MRLRNIPGSREAIAESRWCVQEPEQFKGNWNQIFGNRNPIHIEIGMGKGRFLMANAQEHPQTNYIGIEKYSSVLLRALQKMEDAPLENIRFIRMEAESITDIFEEGENLPEFLRPMAQGQACQAPADFPPVFCPLPCHPAKRRLCGI